MSEDCPCVITETNKADFTEIVIKNKLTGEFVSIIPEYGARIKELRLSNGKDIISILKAVTDINSNDRDDIFTNAKLSPFAGRIKDGKYSFQQAEYSLPINYPEENNACHGFVFNRPFNVVAKALEGDSASCTLDYLYDNEYEGYPFRYLISITYRLTANEGLAISTKVKNRSTTIMPVSDGWHFYYDLGIVVDELKLKLDVSDNIEFDSRNVPSGNKVKYDDFNVLRAIGSTQLDSCFRVNSRERIVTQLISEKLNANLNIWQEAGINKYNYLVIYIPKYRKSLSIEPLTSNINSFNNGDGLIKLKPDEEVILNTGIKLSALK